MLLNGGSAVERQSQRLLKALKMLDVVRSVFMSVWAACTVMGFQNAMPPHLKGRLSPLKTGKPFPHIAGWLHQLPHTTRRDALLS